MLALILVAAAASQPIGRELSIVYLSNRHGEVAPCHCDTSPQGGVDRQVAAIQEIRRRTPNLLVIDGGDNFFADAEQARSATAAARAELIADALAQLKADVMVPGERDFLAGGPRLRELGARAHALWVVSNAVAKPDRPPMFLPYWIAKVGAQRVLLLGFWSSETLPPAAKEEGYKLEDPVVAAKRFVAMHKQSVDLIVAIAHTTGQVEEKLAEEVPELSLILSGHEGRLQFGARAAGKSQIVSAGKQGKQLIRVDLRYRERWPSFTAGLEVQKHFRGSPRPGDPLTQKDTLFFQLWPMSAEVKGVEELRARAQAIDPTGYR